MGGFKKGTDPWRERTPILYIGLNVLKSFETKKKTFVPWEGMPLPGSTSDDNVKRIKLLVLYRLS